jgi:hypothetical protein
VRGDDIFSAGKREAKRNSQEVAAKRDERRKVDEGGL